MNPSALTGSRASVVAEFKSMPTALRCLTILTLLGAALGTALAMVKLVHPIPGLTAFGVSNPPPWQLAAEALGLLGLARVQCWRRPLAWWLQVLLFFTGVCWSLTGPFDFSGGLPLLLVLSFRITRDWYGVGTPDAGRAEYEG